MNKAHMQLALAIGGAALLTGTVGFSLTQNDNNELSLIHASNTYSIVLSSANAPVLQEGRGEIVDNKGVTWEYSNALSYNEGHVTLDNDGYCGVSADTE